MPAERQRRAALFLDRDGTLIHDRGYLSDPAGVALLPGVREALRRARRHYRLFLFSNQSGIARGYFDWRAVDAVQARLLARLRLPAPLFDARCEAPEGPDVAPSYRKPSPRFILECIEQFDLDPARCWMIGDKLSDLQAGRRAGIRCVLLAATLPTDATLCRYLREGRIPVYASLADWVAAQ